MIVSDLPSDERLSDPSDLEVKLVTMPVRLVTLTDCTMVPVDGLTSRRLSGEVMPKLASTLSLLVRLGYEPLATAKVPVALAPVRSVCPTTIVLALPA